MKRPVLAATTLFLGLALPAVSQTPTPSPTPGPPTVLPAGVTFPTEDSARANGVRLQVDATGGVWFLEAGADRVSVLRNGTITSWQLRPDDELGANPVDFRLDGTVVWILESGQSQIPAGSCSIARLDTVTGELTEWVVPGSIPAAFYQAPDGKYWIPISGGALLEADFVTGEVVIRRSAATFAYADMAVAPDGSLWMADFGNNRIVRYVPGATTETSWTYFNPAAGRLNTTEIQFDDQGFLWLSQFSGDRMDRFDPATGELRSYFGVVNPLHFVFDQKKLYVTAGQAQAAVTVLDPAIALPTVVVLEPVELDVGSTVSGNRVTTRTSVITPTTFTSESEPIPEADIDVIGTASQAGLRTQFPSTNTYGIAVAAGMVWMGTDGELASLNLQAIGGPTDVSVPAATSVSGPADNRVRIEMTLSNRGTAAVGGDALYLYSPGAFAARTSFSIAPGETQFFPDAFGNLGSTVIPANGAVRFRVTTGAAADLVATVRSARIRPGGSSFGYALRPDPVAGPVGAGSSATLFTGGRATEVSVLALYSLAGATGELSLVAPDGTIRGTRAIAFAANTREEYNPAASAFGVAAQAGDVIRVSVATGSLQPEVSIFDVGTVDIAPSTPVTAGVDWVIPNAGTVAGAGRTFISDLYLSNPSATAAEVEVTFYAIGATAPPAVADLTLAAGESRAIQDFLPELFGITAGQGSLLVTASAPIAAAVRIGASYPAGDYAGFAPGIPGGAGLDGESAIAIGLPQTAARRSHLLLFNRGDAGTITIAGFRGDGTATPMLAVELGDHESFRVDSVFAALGAPGLAAGRIRVDVPAGMNVYAWTAEVDGSTGDADLAPLR